MGPTPSVLVWGLYILWIHRYIMDVLKTDLPLYMQMVPSAIILQQGSAWWHTMQNIQHFLSAYHVLLLWPACLPSLSLIAQVWDMVVGWLAHQATPAGTTNEFWVYIDSMARHSARRHFESLPFHATPCTSHSLFLVDAPCTDCVLLITYRSVLLFTYVLYHK